MDIALVLARLVLAAVFVVASLAKFADRAGSRQAIIDFGVPRRMAGPLGIALPLAELTVAVVLVPTSSAWLGALGALALLLLFVAAIGANLARGRKPDCRCFGQLSSSPVGWTTLARNGVLAAAAAFVVWQGRESPGRSAVAWLADLTTAELLGLVAWLVTLGLLAFVVGLLINLLRQSGRLVLRIEAIEEGLAGAGIAAAPVEAPAEPQPGLPVGTPAPGFHLSGLYGEMLTLDSLRAMGKPVLLLFTDPECGPCNALLPEVGIWQREHAAELTIALISRGTPDANRAKSAEHGLVNVLLQRDREVAETYQEEGTPAAVIVRPEGTIGSALAAGADQIRALVASTRQSQGAASPPPSAPLSAAASGDGRGDRAAVAMPAPQIGDPAPSVRLPDLSGKTVDLAEFRGSKTVVLFWDPGCGFCQQMLQDLKAWEVDPPEEAPRLLLVSTGTFEANRALGLRSPVLLDEGFRVRTAFGANGTPMAVLVDEEGKIASGVAAGAPAALGLAGGQQSSQATTSPAPKIGDPAPPLKLPDLRGHTVNLAGYRGTNTLVLFWNPACEFCDEILDDLKAWEAQAIDGAPKLLVISSGNVEANQAMGLSSPVLLDPSFSAGNAFGVSGTPMAVLVDAEGRIASEIAAGGPPVLELARKNGQAVAR